MFNKRNVIFIANNRNSGYNKNIINVSVMYRFCGNCIPLGIMKDYRFCKIPAMQVRM